MPGAKNWCFTLNNPTEECIQRLISVDLSIVAYVIFGKEIGDSGTPHLQGFVSFRSRKTLSQTIAIIGQSHCSVARSTKASIAYCKKDGDFMEIGETPVSQGKRSDLQSFKEDVKNGMISLKEIREKHSNIYAKYSKFVVEYVMDNSPKTKVTSYPLRDWQSELNTKLNGEIDSRKIIFVVDLVGDQGKSWFFHYYCQNHDEEKNQVLLPGKKNDMAMALLETPRVVFLDCPRSKQGDFIQYDFLEEVKNGYVFSNKYHSRFKRFPTPHVCVGMNEQPDTTKLSVDRYEIINL